MAKIGNLEVERINIANNAVNGLVASGTSVVVPNAFGTPILLALTATINWVDNGQGLTANLGVIAKVTRSRGSLDLINRSLSYQDTNFGSKNIHVADGALDADAQTSETYTLSINLSPSQSSASVSTKQVQAFYVKR